MFSPNGRWLAYVSNELGQDNVYVQRYPGPGGREVVSMGGGAEPVWSPDGDEVFYRKRNHCFSVKIAWSRNFRPRRRQAFEGIVGPTEAGSADYDIARTALVRLVRRGRFGHHLMFQNWFEE